MPPVAVSSPALPNADAFPPGDGVLALEDLLRRWAQITPPWDLLHPLPSTREIGLRYGISNVSVCRVLKRLEIEHVVWQAANGRYYLYASRRLLERQRTYVCLTAPKETWGHMQAEVLMAWDRTDDRCSSTWVVHRDPERGEENGQSWHDRVIVEQRRFLREFFADPHHAWDGTLFDSHWRDEALAAFPHRLRGAVMLGRETEVAGLASLAVDFDAAALLGLAHLHARGYREVRVVSSSRVGLAQQQQFDAIVRAAGRLGQPIASELAPVSAVALDARSRSEDGGAGGAGIGWFCLDEVAAEEAVRSIQVEGGRPRRKAGVLAALPHPRLEELNVTRFVVDPGEAGFWLAELLQAGAGKGIRLAPELVLGAST
jgi:hypothetical protein